MDVPSPVRDRADALPPLASARRDAPPALKDSGRADHRSRQIQLQTYPPKTAPLRYGCLRGVVSCPLRRLPSDISTLRRSRHLNLQRCLLARLVLFAADRLSGLAHHNERSPDPWMSICLRFGFIQKSQYRPLECLAMRKTGILSRNLKRI